MGLTYVVGVTGQVTVWPPGHASLAPRPRSGRGVVATRQRLGDARHERPLSVKEVALGLEPTQWQSIEWREGTNACA
ncbi:transposase [Verminephrobacter aporrectodeae]|uniref:transposase n=1 Tax=Verminephrobacter aporrectodeae TaxID=1110389 RepID=UPI0022433800|nr:transposase [Verminephrobacter aporrectodeae]